MKSKKVTEQKILESVIKLSAKVGIENIRTAKIASAAGMSEGMIYRFFDSKEQLITSAFIMICGEVDLLLKTQYLSGLEFYEQVEKLWNYYLDYLINNTEKAKFYMQFRYSIYMNNGKLEERYEKVTEFFTSLVNSYISSSIYPKVRNIIFWSFIFDTTVSLALQTAEGLIEMGEQNRKIAFSLILKLLK